MKKLTLLICIISAFAASAQVYLLPDFTLCIAKCKAGSLPLREKFNYNITSQRMEFMQDGEILELADIQMIDTVFLPGHKMIPVGNRFAEVMYQKQGEFNLLVDYKSHKINKGKKGAMGIATQGTVQNIDFTLGTSRTHDDSWKKGIDIESENIECTYYLQQGK